MLTERPRSISDPFRGNSYISRVAVLRRSTMSSGAPSSYSAPTNGANSSASASSGSPNGNRKASSDGLNGSLLNSAFTPSRARAGTLQVQAQGQGQGQQHDPIGTPSRLRAQAPSYNLNGGYGSGSSASSGPDTPLGRGRSATYQSAGGYGNGNGNGFGFQAESPAATARSSSYQQQNVSFANGGFASPSAPRRNGINSSNWRRGAAPPSGRPSYTAAPFARRANDSPSTNPSEIHLSTLPESSITYPSPVIHIAQERSRPDSNPHMPAFLAHFAHLTTEDDYYTHVLPYLSTCTLVIDSAPDLNWLHAFLTSPGYPQAMHAITKVAFPQMYWFSGVGGNRQANPFLVFLSRLPAVQEVTLTLHTAGLTGSAYSERDRVRMEEADFERSKMLKVLPVQSVVRHYDLARLFECRGLRVVRLHCVTSEMVSYYARQAGEPLDTFREVVAWVKRGFRDASERDVVVEAAVVTPEAPK